MMMSRIFPKEQHRRGLDVEQMIWPQILLCPCVLLRPQQHPAPCTPFWDAAYAHFPQSIVLPLSGSIAWSIYNTDLFILFQDNFHHCSKCIWKERRRLAMQLQTLGNGGKNTSSSANVFSLLACGVGASFNFNQMSNREGLVEKKLSLIYGVSCKQESTSQFPFASCLHFLPALVRENFPLSVCSKDLSVFFLSTLVLQLRSGGVLSVFFVSLFCVSKSKGNRMFCR